jgi:hypothetical protein
MHTQFIRRSWSIARRYRKWVDDLWDGRMGDDGSRDISRFVDAALR